MDLYFLSVDEDIFLSFEYKVKDKYHDLAKNIILNNILKYDSMHVKHSDAAKEMLDKLENLYLRGKLHFFRNR